MKKIIYPIEISECLNDESPLEKRLIRIDFRNIINTVLPVNYCPICEKYLVKNRMEKDIKRVGLFAYNSNYNTKRKLREITRVEIVDK